MEPERGVGRHLGVECNAGLFAVRRLMHRVKTFGFYFASLDLKQSALAIRSVVGRCLNEQNWLDKTPEERADLIEFLKTL